jgi:hypothetical protein
MQRPGLPALIFAALLSLSGCAVRELCNDQDKIRHCLLHLYTNQIMDNLIRASQGLPIIQLDYSNATATITVRENASLNDALATTRSTVITKAMATTVGITRTTFNTLTGAVGGENTNQVAVTASPVTTINEVYDAYLGFLSLPGSLQASPSPPPKGVALITAQCGDTYYWVPIQFRKEFLGLALATTAQRGKPLLPPDEYFSVRMIEVVSPKPLSKEKKAATIVVKFDMKVPNDVGRLEIRQTDKQGKETVYRLFVTEYDPADMPRPSETDRLTLQFIPERMPDGMNTPFDLNANLPLEVRLYLTSSRPIQSPTTPQLLDRVNFQLQQIQFNQLRTGGGP